MLDITSIVQLVGSDKKGLTSAPLDTSMDDTESKGRFASILSRDDDVNSLAMQQKMNASAVTSPTILGLPVQYHMNQPMGILQGNPLFDINGETPPEVDLIIQSKAVENCTASFNIDTDADLTVYGSPVSPSFSPNNSTITSALKLSDAEDIIPPYILPLGYSVAIPEHSFSIIEPQQKEKTETWPYNHFRYSNDGLNIQVADDIRIPDSATNINLSITELPNSATNKPSNNGGYNARKDWQPKLSISQHNPEITKEKNDDPGTAAAMAKFVDFTTDDDVDSDENTSIFLNTLPTTILPQKDRQIYGNIEDQTITLALNSPSIITMSQDQAGTSTKMTVSGHSIEANDGPLMLSYKYPITSTRIAHKLEFTANPKAFMDEIRSEDILEDKFIVNSPQFDNIQDIARNFTEHLSRIVENENNIGKIITPNHSPKTSIANDSSKLYLGGLQTINNNGQINHDYSSASPLVMNMGPDLGNVKILLNNHRSDETPLSITLITSNKEGFIALQEVFNSGAGETSKEGFQNSHQHKDNTGSSINVTLTMDESKHQQHPSRDPDHHQHHIKLADIQNSGNTDSRQYQEIIQRNRQGLLDLFV